MPNCEQMVFYPGDIVTVLSREELDAFLREEKSLQLKHWAQDACEPFLGQKMQILQVHQDIIDHGYENFAMRFKYSCKPLCFQRGEMVGNIAPYYYKSSFFSFPQNKGNSHFEACSETDINALF